MRILLLLALAACDWSLHRMQEPIACETHGATTLLPGGTCDQPPPEGAVAIAAPETPPPVTRALLERGRDRFERICAACHGLAADGDSEVARAMELRRPPSLLGDDVRGLPDARILDAIGNGYGLMPSYAALVAPRDRWAILHYLRALQEARWP